MAENPYIMLQRIVNKASQLTEQYIVMRKAKQDAEEKIREQAMTIKKLEEEINRLKQENQYLKVVSITDPKREHVEESRALLIELVREIDKCISELSEE